MSFVRSIYTKNRHTSCHLHKTPAGPSLFPSADLLDVNLTMYYLQNLPECRINVAKGLALLYELEESEEQIYQAVSLRSRSLMTVGGGSCGFSDQGAFRIQEEYDNEKRAIQKERTLLQNHLKNENHKIVIVEGCIYSLPEPQRSVLIARYIDRLSWQVIQQKLKRSASRVYVLNKDGIQAVLDSVRAINAMTAKGQTVGQPVGQSVGQPANILCSKQ